MKKNIYETFSPGFLLTKSSRMIMKRYEEGLGQTGISPLQSGVLYVISFHRSPSQKEISEILFIDKVTLSKIIFNLQQNKLISHITSNNDRREKRWTLTAKGEEKLRQVEEIDHEIEKYMRHIVSKNECDTLSKVLKKLLIKGSS
ncbi:MarR family winged helix-turn-helix transcriptional regulator [Pseudobacteriovorax antillogorgiicola]|uniref:DNA-binding transcriptional regulator, MarR family n=1 Tax=Pseudobacteriovorax antillogorgiicola TaxID=1513793 RepID=A0A1Y6C1Y1_9BACT|nr:MarR family transcriptional regulator [Pseudobacteriovorax antillogorgiicola]TCS50761.1 DNA-binding MarR family transcriptional regulator [Pseudobacteriovorax antillogorgiicola]SMF41197.1 DNA-binding transcriptional regulator, MarR family [Pseudobacteriovorax antillogorgiicola]